jgi:hypothetical protein
MFREQTKGRVAPGPFCERALYADQMARPASQAPGVSVEDARERAKGHAPRVFRRAPERFSALRPPLDSGRVKQSRKPRAQTCAAGTRWAV